MKIQTINGWNAMKSNKSLANACGSWKGIAIGPESEEGRVLVDGHILQSGRILPLSSSQYTLEREYALSTELGPDAITKLQVMLFDSVGELVVPVARPNHRFRAYHLGTGVHTSVLTVPYVGRRQAMFAFSPNTTLLRYEVIGRIIQTNGDFIDITLVDVSGAFATPFAIYVGGTNEAENYHTLQLKLQMTNTEEIDVVCETIGEIGTP